MGEVHHAGHHFPGDPHRDNVLMDYVRVNNDLPPLRELSQEERVALLDTTPEQVYRYIEQRHSMSREEAEALLKEHEAALDEEQ